MSVRTQNFLLCLCGPAGSGKSSIATQLVAAESSLVLSISTTTRAPRGAEINGREYRFVAPDEFQRKIQSGEFLEHAEYGGNRYGTERVNYDSAVAQGRDLVLDIDVQGVKRLKSELPHQVVSIFITPPSWKDLESRLRGRQTETEAQIQARLQIADREIEELLAPGISDYVVLNQDLNESIQRVRAIVIAERAKSFRQPREELAKLLRS